VHFSAFGCGAKMTALPVLMANIALHIGVRSVRDRRDGANDAHRLGDEDEVVSVLADDAARFAFQVVPDNPGLAFVLEDLVLDTPMPVSSTAIRASGSALS
jgi:hypothetical protein